MVNRHNRIPAILILLLAVGAGYAYLRKAKADARPAEGLEALEAKISSGKAEKNDWLSYAVALDKDGKPARAAQAYRKVLEFEPHNRGAKIELVVALANAGDREGLAGYLKDLVYAEAKMCVDLFERKELRAYLSDPVFANFQKEARAQAMD